MTRSFIRVRPSDAVHHFRRRAAWNDGTVCGSLAHRSACNAAPPHAACPRPTPRRSTRRTAAARNTKAQIRHHPVSVHVDKLLKYLNNFSLSSILHRAEKGSLLSRLFRRSGRAKQRQIETYSAQFPPAEWFNSRAVHLHSVGTQTADHVSGT